MAVVPFTEDLGFGREDLHRFVRSDVFLRIDPQDRADPCVRTVRCAGRDEKIRFAGDLTRMDDGGRHRDVVSENFRTSRSILIHGPETLDAGPPFVDVLPPRVDDASVFSRDRIGFRNGGVGQFFNFSCFAVEAEKDGRAQNVAPIAEDPVPAARRDEDDAAVREVRRVHVVAPSLVDAELHREHLRVAEPVVWIREETEFFDGLRLIFRREGQLRQSGTVNADLP